MHDGPAPNSPTSRRFITYARPLDARRVVMGLRSWEILCVAFALVWSAWACAGNSFEVNSLFTPMMNLMDRVGFPPRSFREELFATGFIVGAAFVVAGGLRRSGGMVWRAFMWMAAIWLTLAAALLLSKPAATGGLTYLFACAVFLKTALDRAGINYREEGAGDEQ